MIETYIKDVPGNLGHLVSLIFTPNLEMRTLRPREVKQPVTYLSISFASIRSDIFKIPTRMFTLPFHLPHTQAVQPVPHTCPSSHCLSFYSPQSRAPIVIVNFVYKFLPLPTSQPLSQCAFLTGRRHFRWILENKENFLRIEREGGSSSRKREQHMQKHGCTNSRLKSGGPRSSTWLMHWMNVGSRGQK